MSLETLESVYYYINILFFNVVTSITKKYFKQIYFTNITVKLNFYLRVKSTVYYLKHIWREKRRRGKGSRGHRPIRGWARVRVRWIRLVSVRSLIINLFNSTGLFFVLASIRLHRVKLAEKKNTMFKRSPFPLHSYGELRSVACGCDVIERVDKY